MLDVSNPSPYKGVHELALEQRLGTKRRTADQSTLHEFGEPDDRAQIEWRPPDGQVHARGRGVNNEDDSGGSLAFTPLGDPLNRLPDRYCSLEASDVRDCSPPYF